MRYFTSGPITVFSFLAFLLAGCSNAVSPKPAVTNTGTSSGDVVISTTSSSGNGYAGHIYAANNSVAAGNSSTIGDVVAYPVSSSGSAIPAIPAFNGTIYAQVRSDGDGTLYFVSYAQNIPHAITVSSYAQVLGALEPVSSFNTTLASDFAAMAADTSGNVFISETDGTLLEFPVSAKGAATPSKTLVFAACLDRLAIDSGGNLYAHMAGGTLITEYTKGFTTTAPANAINLAAYVGTIGDLAAPGFTDLYIVGSGLSGNPSVFEFPSTNGSPAPIKTISGAATLLPALAPSLVIDGSGNIYVEGFSAAPPGDAVFVVFNSTATGNVAPAYTFTGDFQNPSGSSFGLAVI